MFLLPSKRKQATLRESIITSLSNEFPLTIKQLISRHYRFSGAAVSYQAAHKELSALVAGEIIVREGPGYLLSIAWIKNTAAFFNETEKAYARIKRLHPNIIKKVQNEGDSLNLKFSSINEIDEFFVSVMDTFEELAQNKPVVMHYRHNWYPLLYAKKESQILEKSSDKAKFYCLCGSNTPLDRWATEYEKSIGMNVKFKTGVGQRWDLQVYGDAIIQFYLDPSVLEKIDRFFSANKKFLEYNPRDILQIMSLRGEFSVMIYRNSLLAEQLRKETMREFRR